MFVEKENCPTNITKVRSIEEFWLIRKEHVYAKAWTAKNIDIRDLSINQTQDIKKIIYYNHRKELVNENEVITTYYSS